MCSLDIMAEKSSEMIGRQQQQPQILEAQKIASDTGKTKHLKSPKGNIYHAQTAGKAKKIMLKGVRGEGQGQKHTKNYTYFRSHISMRVR